MRVVLVAWVESGTKSARKHAASAGLRETGRGRANRERAAETTFKA